LEKDRASIVQGSEPSSSTEKKGCDERKGSFAAGGVPTDSILSKFGNAGGVLNSMRWKRKEASVLPFSSGTRYRRAARGCSQEVKPGSELANRPWRPARNLQLKSREKV